MATSIKTICVVCNKEMRTYICDGCSQRFCHKHLDEHRTNLEKEFDQIETDHDELRQMFNEQKENPRTHPLIQEIDQWETTSINKIQQTANQCREDLTNHINSFLLGLENKLNNLAREIKVMRQENEFNDLDIEQLKENLKQLQEELLQPPNLFIEQQSTSFINCISVRISSSKL